MRFQYLVCFSLWIGAFSSEPSYEIQLDLKEPTYRDGILFTTAGGVVQGEDLRIQAKSIQYIHKNGIHSIEAEQSLMLQYKGRVYTGEELFFDFTTKTGVLFGGKTKASVWFLSGEEIQIEPDGSYQIERASMTTSENKLSPWKLFAQKVHVVDQNLLQASDLSIHLGDTPIFWLPKLNLNMERFGEIFSRKTLTWDSGKGPKAEIRYLLYSGQDFALFTRLGYRYSVGWQSSLETEYRSSHSPLKIFTKSYVGKDNLVSTPITTFRYRAQGNLDYKKPTHRVQLKWDRFSDEKMPSDFKNEDFEVNTAKKTGLWIDYQGRFASAFFRVRPKVNSFESVKQDLPSFQCYLSPVALANTNLYHEGYVKGGYLDFSYSDKLSSTQTKTVPKDFGSGRFALEEKIWYPLQVGPLHFTPFASWLGIAYTKTPSRRSQTLAKFTYGATLNAQGVRSYKTIAHLIEPYFKVLQTPPPTLKDPEHYLFSIEDAHGALHQMQLGIKNLLFTRENQADFLCDLSINGFFSEMIPQTCIPKIYFNCEYRRPFFQFLMQQIWNARRQRFDSSNAKFSWSINDHLAFSFEGRYRSSYQFKKADESNFLLDVTRLPEDLLLSPLSDRRVALLGSFFAKLSPLWDMKLAFHHGFYRKNEPSYTTVKLDLSTWVSSGIKCRFGASHSNAEKYRFGLSFDLMK